MARVKVGQEVKRLSSWDDVDMRLCEIGEAQRAVRLLEAEMQEGIDALKLKADMAATPHKARIAELEREISQFADEHREELGNLKSRKLTFGMLGYRKSTKVVLPRAAAKLAEVIRALKERGMSDCVVAPPEKVDKDALRKYPPNDICAVGAGLDVTDDFWYEVDEEKLAEK